MRSSSRMLAGLAIAAAVVAMSLTAADRARATEPAAYQKGVIEVSAPAPIAFAPVVVSQVESASVQLVRHELSSAHDIVVCVAADPGADPRAVADSMDTNFLPTPMTTRHTRRYLSAVAPVHRRSLRTPSRTVDSLTRFSPTARSAL